MTRTGQIRELLELLAPAPDLRDECRRYIERALDVMDSTKRAAAAIKAQRAATRQSGRSYQAALERMLAVGRAHARSGGALAVPIAELEHTVAFAAAWDAGFARALPPRGIAERQATALAYNLLWQWDRPAHKSRGGTWYRAAAILLGNPDADLYRYLCEFQKPVSA